MALEAKTLYQEIILEHGKNPRNEGPLADASHVGIAKNPLCGDRVTLRLRLDGDRVQSVRFEARGCMIAHASASLMTEAIEGRTRDEALSLAATIEALVSADPPPVNVGELEPLRGVREFPSRKACVTLAWQALKSALASPSGADSKKPE